MVIMNMLIISVIYAAVVVGVQGYYNDSAIVPGDLYIAGIHTLFMPGATSMECGQLRHISGFQYHDAQLFAVNRINAQKGQDGDFKDLRVNIGAIATADCKSTERGVAIATDLQSGVLRYQANGQDIEPATIMAFIASSNSHKTIAVADALTPMKMTQISYSATSTVLSKESTYPYFLRTVPDDDKTVEAMVEFAKSMNWTGVQIVHEDTTYGKTATISFKKYAEANGICIQQVFCMDTPGLPDEKIIEKLDSVESARVVVILSRFVGIKRLFYAREAKGANTLVFFGGETWGKREDPEVFTHGKGSFSVAAISEEAQAYEDHLSSKNGLGSYPENPFFDTYYKLMFGCNETTCGTAAVTTLPSHYQDVYLLHDINAVYAIAIGIMKTLKDICGDDYTSICPEFLSAPDLREKMFENTMSAEFTDIVGQPFKFTGRERIRGFTFHRVGDNEYIDVGVYNSDKEFVFNQEFLDNYGYDITSTCE